MSRVTIPFFRKELCEFGMYQHVEGIEAVFLLSLPWMSVYSVERREKEFRLCC